MSYPVSSINSRRQFRLKISQSDINPALPFNFDQNINLHYHIRMVELATGGCASALNHYTTTLLMKNALLTLTLAATLLSSKASTLDFPISGFQIAALETSKGSTPASSIIMFLPATDGFAPNVNVQIQPYTESIDSYMTLSKAQFVQVKWKIISENKDTSGSWTVEYINPAPGKDLHFYAKAVSDGKYVYLVTATAKEPQWASVKAALKKCVDSFKLK